MLLKLVRSTPLYAWAFNLRTWALTGFSRSLDDALLWNDAQQALNHFLEALNRHFELLKCEEFKLSFCGFRTTGYQSSIPYLAMNCLSFRTDPPPPPLICHFEQNHFTLAQSIGELSKGLVSFSIVLTLDESLFKSQVPSSRKSQGPQ
jgi:hypothetical protein